MKRTSTTWLAYLLLALFAYLETSVGPAMPFLRSKLNLSYTLASIHFSAFAVGMILAGTVGDRVVVRIGRRSSLWIGMAGFSGGAILFALSPAVIGSILGVFCMGTLGTISLVSNQAILGDLHSDHRAVALSESNVAASAAAVLAPLAIGGFARFGPSWEFALIITGPVLALFYWRFRAVPIPEIRKPAFADESAKPLPKTFWIMFVVLFLAMSVEWCIAYWGADFMTDVVELRRSAAATTMSIFFAAMVLGRFLGSRLAMTHRGERLLIGALLTGIVGFPFFWLGSNPIVNLAGLFVLGLGVANFYPLTVAIATGLSPESVDQAATRLAISGGAALLIAPFIVGAIADRVDLRWGLGIVLPLMLAALTLVWSANRSRIDTEQV